MVKLKLLSAALFAAAVITAPAMARESHLTSRYVTQNGYAGIAPGTAYGAAPYAPGTFAYVCVPAPRVGQFAGQPWDNDVPCQPGPRAAY